MSSLVIILSINSESDRRGKPHSTIEAMTEDPNHEVRIVAIGLAHGPHGTIGADLALKVTPKVRLTPTPHRAPRSPERPHPRPRKRWNKTAKTPIGDS